MDITFTIIVGIIIVIVVIIGVMLQITSPKINIVVAGNVQAEKKISKEAHLKISNNFVHNGKVLNLKEFYIGKVEGNSMALKGLLNDDIFLADKYYETAKEGDVFVLETPEGENKGIHKLREIVSIDEKNGNIKTKSCDSESKDKNYSQHHKNDLVARVCYISRTA